MRSRVGFCRWSSSRSCSASYETVAHSGSSSTRSFPGASAGGELSRGGGGVVLLTNEAGSNATSTGGSGPPGSTSRAEAEQHAVLEVGVGQEEHHRRGLILAEIFDQGGELVVGDRVGIDGHLPGEVRARPVRRPTSRG